MPKSSAGCRMQRRVARAAHLIANHANDLVGGLRASRGVSRHSPLTQQSTGKGTPNLTPRSRDPQFSTTEQGSTQLGA